MDRTFLFLAPRKNVIRVKNENCEFLRKLCTDFLVALSVETAWMFTLSISSCHSNNIKALKESSIRILRL